MRLDKIIITKHSFTLISPHPHPLTSRVIIIVPKLCSTLIQQIIFHMSH